MLGTFSIWRFWDSKCVPSLKNPKSCPGFAVIPPKLRGAPCFGHIKWSFAYWVGIKIGPLHHSIRYKVSASIVNSKEKENNPGQTWTNVLDPQQAWANQRDFLAQRQRARLVTHCISCPEKGWSGYVVAILTNLERERILGILFHNRRCFDDKLVDSKQPDQISSWDVINCFLVPTHHHNSSLDALDVEVCLATRLVVWSHDSHLLACFHGAWENTAEGDETALVRCWDHLADVKTHRPLWVAFLDGFEKLAGKKIKNQLYTWNNTTSPSAPTGPVYKVSAR